MNWLISANSGMYDHASSFEHHGFIDWRQGQTNFSIGDTAYIYCTKPAQRIRYKCLVEKINMSFRDIRDDREYWKNEAEYRKTLKGLFFRLKLLEQTDSDRLILNHLKDHGLKSAPQGPMRLVGEVLTYVQDQFTNIDNDDFFPETIDSNIDVYEGIKKQITVNKYERSSIARAKCIEFHGCTCCVCGFDFRRV